MEKPDQFDDPNTTLARLIEATKAIRVPGVDLNPLKLRVAWGDTIINLLSALAGLAIKTKGISFNEPLTFSDSGADDRVDDVEVVDGELDNNNLDDDGNQFDDDAGNNGLDDDDDEVPLFQIKGSVATANGTDELMDRMTELANTFHVDPEEWRLEVERVTPLLKVSIQNDHKDWRLHLQQMEQNEKEILQLESQTAPLLQKVQVDIQKTMEKISSREKYLNQQLEPAIDDYRKISNIVSQSKVAYNQGLNEQNRLISELSQISEDLEKMKSQMDELGSGMNDAKPIVKIKQAMAQLKSEMKKIDLRTGVVQHRLYHARMSDKADMVANLEKVRVSKSVKI